MSLKQAFDLFDIDHSGAIDEEELYGAMKAMGLRTSRKECRKMISDQDEDDNGEIDFQEFLEMMRLKMVPITTFQVIIFLVYFGGRACYEVLGGGRGMIKISLRIITF